MLTLNPFEIIRPIYENSQKETLNWLIQAYAQSEACSQGKKAEQFQLFTLNLKQKLEHIAYKPNRIAKRGHVLSDFLHTELKKMKVYRLKEFSFGVDLIACSKIFSDQIESVYSYLVHMSQKSGFTIEYILQNALFASHPGGLKIIQSIQAVLCSNFAQVAHSKFILQQFSSMSSATLPHLWKEILEDPKVIIGSLIVSLAFGSGLTICGSIMEKRSRCG